jgi:RsiW-degrading membrane proteinase PrsW (M82 family)
MIVAVNLALAIGPAALVLLWAYRRDRIRREPPRLVLGAFGLGVVAVAAAIVVGLLLDPLAWAFGDTGALLFRAYVVAGLLEEAAKLAVVLFFIARHTEFDEVADGMVYTMAASLGFAVVENILYLAGPSTVLLVRGITAVPLHATAGGIMGYFIGMNRIEKRGSILAGLFLAVLLHGTYDFLLFTGAGSETGLVSLATIPLLVVAGVATAVLFRRAVRSDQAAGRVPQGSPAPVPPRPQQPRS